MSGVGATVVLLRHAPTASNALNLFQGQCDPPLSPDGANHAADAARHLADVEWASIVSSPQLRARQTCDHIARAAGRRRDGDIHDLRERNLSHLDRLSRTSVEAGEPGILNRLVTDPDYAPDGGESLRDVAARAGRALTLISAAHNGPILAVTHGGVITALQSCSHPDKAPTYVQPAHALIVTVHLTPTEPHFTVTGADLSPANVRHHLAELTRPSPMLERTP